jgi:hypothetical protein
MMPEDAKYIKKAVDWNKVFSLLAALQKDKFNEKTMRFVKSDIVSAGIEQYSNGKFKYVDQTGCDFILPKKKLRVELKCGECMFPKRIDYTRSIRVYNSHGTHDGTLPHTFDYLLIVEPGKAGIISYDALLPFIVNVSDGKNARIHMDKIDIIAENKDFKRTSLSLESAYNGMVAQTLESFQLNYESDK